MPLALSAARPLEGELVDDLPAGIKRLRQRRDGSFTGGKPPPGRQGIRASGTERIPRVNRARLTGRGLAVLGAAAATPTVIRDTQRLRQHPERRPSAGRYAAGASFGGYHALAAGKPGHKGRAVTAAVPAIAAGLVANKYSARAMAPHIAAVQHAVSYGNPVGGHLRAAGRAALPMAAAAYGANALMTRHNASMGRYKEQTKMAKSDSGPSTGRYVTGALFGGWHGLVAGKKGRKLGAGAVEMLPNLVASPIAGAAIAAGKPGLVPLAQAAKYGGRLKAVQINHRAGNLKPETVTASKSMTCLPTNTRYVVQRTVDGRYAGNGTTLTHVQVVSRRPRNGSVPTVATPTSARSGGRTSVSRVSPTRLPAAGQGDRGTRIR